MTDDSELELKIKEQERISLPTDWSNRTDSGGKFYRYYMKQHKSDPKKYPEVNSRKDWRKLYNEYLTNGKFS